MASELFIGQGRPRPRLFLIFLLLFLILGTCLASAVTGADYVRGNGGATVPDDRVSPSRAAFSLQDDRRVLIAVIGEETPQAFLLWRLRPAAGDMTVTVYAADAPSPSGEETLADLFGDGGRGGCEAVYAALARPGEETPAYYIAVTDDALRTLTERLGGSVSVVPAEESPDARSWGDGFAALCERYFTAERADKLRNDFTALVNTADTNLGISHFVAYADALTALAAANAGQRCAVLVMERSFGE